VAEDWNETPDAALIPELIDTPAPVPPAPLRVFVVDDEFNIASTLGLILCHHGYEASSFTGPLEALQAVIMQPPDLLISDVAMPQLSGVELALKVRAYAPGCKILLFSGEPSSVELVEAARADGHTFELLPRPLHPAELLKRIQKLTEEAGLSVADSK
jgi:DNA-binding response OmpR family regulator